MYQEVVIPRSAKQSIDIPKEFINKKVKVILEEVAFPKRKPNNKKSVRSGWVKQFKKMHTAGDDALLMPEGIDLNDSDWQW